MRSALNIFKDIVLDKTRPKTYPHILKYLKENKGMVREKDEGYRVSWSLSKDTYEDLLMKDRPDLSKKDLSCNRTFLVQDLRLQASIRKDKVVLATVLNPLSFREVRREGFLYYSLSNKRAKDLYTIEDLVKTIMHYIAIYDPDKKLVELIDQDPENPNLMTLNINIPELESHREYMRKQNEYIRKLADDPNITSNLHIFGCGFVKNGDALYFSIYDAPLFERLLKLMDE
jgi:hypothetical protein